MIEWFDLATLEERLTQCPPIGLALRGFFHAQIPASLTALFEREPETMEIEGLGQALAWTGLVDDVPFTVMGQRRGELTGFEISFPALVNAGRIDLQLLECVTTLAPVFRTLRTAHIEHLPFVGEGFAVQRIGAREPLFRSSSRDDADAVAQFLDDPTRFEVKPSPAAPAQWIVAGPRIETTVSRLEIVPTREDADRLARAWSEEFGHAFDVHEGQLPPE